MNAKPVTKKIINSPETCVDDNLRGVIATCPSLHLHPKHRVVTVKNTADTKRVAILAGGGSGHEPFAAGMVGPGMADGAVAGGVFAAPPTGHVLYAITHLYKYNSGGVLVIFGNYTGDRLTFGKAIEKAKNAGIKVEALFLGEDLASSNNKMGGRSLCGLIFFLKMCGAMAAKGYGLMEIHNTAAEIHKYMATLAVCLTACSLPGQPPLFEIGLNEIELGAGEHGEAGVQRLELGTAQQIVTLILDKLLAHLKLQADDRVAVLVDNLGGTTILEMNIIAADVKEYLESKRINLERLYSGHVKTSLEMHGFQICLLHLNKDQGDRWLELLDYPTSVLGWVGGPQSVKSDEGCIGDDDTLLQSQVQKIVSGPRLTSQEQEIFRGSIQMAAEEVINKEAVLNRLDSGCGDGDCGTTLKKFGHAVLSYLPTASMDYPANVLYELSEIAETDMGGTSGGIYSLGLSAASQALAKSTKNDVSTWLSAWQSAMETITKYGGAEPGDRTMLDTLHPAAEVLKQNLKEDFKTLLHRTAEAAEKGAKDTVKMSARAGRASYVAKDHLKDEDAGARAAAIWLQAILNFIMNKY